MVKFLVPSRLSLCFQNEIGLSFSKLKSYKYHLHDYVKFDRNRINLYPFLLHVIITLTPDILCRSSQEKPTFFYLFVNVITITKSPQKNKLNNRIIQLWKGLYVFYNPQTQSYYTLYLMLLPVTIY